MEPKKFQACENEWFNYIMLKWRKSNLLHTTSYANANSNRECAQMEQEYRIINSNFKKCIVYNILFQD